MFYVFFRGRNAVNKYYSFVKIFFVIISFFDCCFLCRFIICWCRTLILDAILFVKWKPKHFVLVRLLQTLRLNHTRRIEHWITNELLSNFFSPVKCNMKIEGRPLGHILLVTGTRNRFLYFLIRVRESKHQSKLSTLDSSDVLTVLSSEKIILLSSGRTSIRLQWKLYQNKTLFYARNACKS